MPPGTRFPRSGASIDGRSAGGRRRDRAGAAAHDAADDRHAARRHRRLGLQLRGREDGSPHHAADRLRGAALRRRRRHAAALAALAAAAVSRSRAAVGDPRRRPFQSDVYGHAWPRRRDRLHRHPAAGAVRGHPGGDLLQRDPALAPPHRNGHRVCRRRPDRRRAAPLRQSAAAVRVAAACFWASAIIQIKRIGDDVDVLALNGWVALLAAPQLALLSWATENGQLAAIAPPTGGCGPRSPSRPCWSRSSATASGTG